MEPEGGISYVGVRIEMMMQVSHKTAVISTSSIEVGTGMAWEVRVTPIVRPPFLGAEPYSLHLCPISLT